MRKDTGFVDCIKCGKHLIEKNPNGLWYFCFGKTPGELIAPVEMYIFGSIKIKCMRKSCNHWNTLTNFPDVE
jgi:hypothetical protein